MKKQEKVFRHKVQVVSRIVMLVSFGLLVLFAITQTAKMFTVVQLEHEKGVPKAWSALLSSSNPETIVVPVVYYDQKSDACNLAASQRQFEMSRCNVNGVLAQGLVQSKLGSDGKPVPSFATASAAASQRTENRGVWGSNFDRWFNEVEGKSQRVDGSITFRRQGDSNVYMFGGPDFFPLDGNEFSAGDYSVSSHNYHFTAMTSFPFEVQANGNERWEFQGDDDVWVFINGQLVLDIGGLHTAVDGHFVINKDGSVSATVNNVTKKIELGLKEGEIAQLDFFYAERSTSEANCKITIRNMIWPIRAEATLEAEVVDNSLVRYTSSLTNRDPANSLNVTHIASFLNNGEEFDENGLGFLPLSDGNIFYTFTPEDESSWRPISVSAPLVTDAGSQLAAPIKLAPNGKAGDTIYFAFYVVPDRVTGTYYNTVTYKTQLGTASALARAAAPATFTDLELPPTDDKKEPEDEKPIPPTDEDGTIGKETPKPDDGSDGYLDPLGESNEIPAGNASNNYDNDLFAPDTGELSFAAVILSEWFLLGTLLVFGVSFAVFYPNRNF